MLQIRHFAALMALAAAPIVSAQTVWRVDARAAAPGDGLAWQSAFPDLQQALAAAAPGDEIWVAAGVYTPSETDASASFGLVQGVGLYGGFHGTESARHERDAHANETILTGDIGRDDIVGSGLFWYSNWNRNTANCGHVVTADGVDASTVLDGFTIADGATGPVGTPAGSPLMFGSGLYCTNASPTVNGCTFIHNLAAFASGGGIYNFDSSPAITRCRFLENYTHLGNGAGIFNYGTSDPTIEDCEFARNIVVAGTGDASGAGLAHWADAPLTITRCSFDQNTARPFYSVGSEIGYGGGVMSFLSGVNARDCVFTRNRANFGGGVMSWGPTNLVNCLFVENQSLPQPNDPYPEGGGEGAAFAIISFAGAEAVVAHCTFVNNHGKKHALVSGSNASMRIENSIVWGSTATSPDVIGTWRTSLGGSFDAAYSCIPLIFDPPEPGEDPIDPENLPGVIDADPLFADADAADWRLSAGSPCRDAGSGALVPPGVDADADGSPRISGPAPDMGAFEFAESPACPADWNGDTVVDSGDFFDFIAAFLAGDADFNGDTATDSGDFFAFISAFLEGGCA